MDRYRETIEAAKRREAVTKALRRQQGRMPKGKRLELMKLAATMPLGERQAPR